jgi:TonB family protein
VNYIDTIISEPTQMNKFLFLFFLFALNSGYAQEDVRTYYSKENEVTDVAGSYFYKVGVKEGEKYIDTVVSYYTVGDKIRSREKYDVDGNRTGIYIEYHESGKIKIKGTYFKGMRIGIFMYWHANGRPNMTLQFPSEAKAISKWSEINYRIANYWDSLGNQIIRDGVGFCDGYLNINDRPELIHERGKVKNGLRDSVWVGIVNGNVVIREVYQNGEFIEGVRIESGKEIAYTDFETSAHYKGGLEGLAKFLEKTVKYPAAARRRHMEGTIFTKFIILPNGHTTDIEPIKKFDPALDEEVLRVTKLMKWEPAVYRGKPIKSTYVLPIKFKLGY